MHLNNLPGYRTISFNLWYSFYSPRTIKSHRDISMESEIYDVRVQMELKPILLDAIDTQVRLETSDATV